MVATLQEASWEDTDSTKKKTWNAWTFTWMRRNENCLKCIPFIIFN